MTGADGLSGIGTVAALALALVLATAGALKARDPRGSKAGMARLGVPLPAVMARVVPIAELATAAMLVGAPRIGAIVAAGLLASFTVVLVAAIRSGRDVSCGCFGSASEAPVTWATVARNGALLVVAAMAATTSTPRVPDVPSVVVATTTMTLLALVVALVGLRLEAGRLWSVALAGETSARSGPRHHSSRSHSRSSRRNRP